MVKQYPNVKLEKRAYHPNDMKGYDLTIIAVNNRTLRKPFMGMQNRQAYWPM
jgi:hypothetical protein